MNQLKTTAKYLRYRFRSQTKHGIHSPFVYNLLTEVIEDNSNYYAYQQLTSLRHELLQSKEVIEIQDFGAGSRYFKSNKRKVSDITRHGISREKYARLLFRLVNYFNPKTIVELGTSIGLTSMHLAAAKKTSLVYTIEGCKNTAAFAQALFKKQGAENIQLINAVFEEALPALLLTLPEIDFLYVDGNHRKQATIDYFEKALLKSNNYSVFVFDDIHWNSGMEEAWEYIRNHTQVRISIDLFFIGLVFFRSEQKQKEHFVIRF